MTKDENGTRYGNTGSNREDYGSEGGDGRLRKRKRVSRPGEVKRITQERPKKEEPTEVRLNKYISNSGVCSRREADEIISAGRVQVNGEKVTTLGHKVQKKTDEVSVDGKVVSPTKKVYVLLNKPKDYITTTNDPQQRKTVMDLIEDVEAERVYPVGRLDRNTTGILIFTNDGDLAQKLMHPSGDVTKIYSVELSQPIEEKHFYKIQNGIKLFDGMMKPDKLALVDRADKRKIGVQIHSGRNRVVRRMFEALGYEVVKLDRVIYANLDKQGLARGQWRNLTEKEVSQLKRVARIG